MTLVLVLLGISLVLTVVTALLLSEAMGTADSSPPARENTQPRSAPRFFAQDIPTTVVTSFASPVPVEVLVVAIERHVRLEREVAESFHLSPTPQTLHMQPASPLMH